MRRSPKFERFGAFDEVFSSGPDGENGPGWYLTLLNFHENGAGAVQVVACCLSKVEQARDEIEALLLSPEGWRAQLVSCVRCSARRSGPSSG